MYSFTQICVILTKLCFFSSLITKTKKQYIAEVTILLTYLLTNVPGVDFDKRRIVISIRGTLSMKVSLGCYKFL
jgi:hypothetical protein